MRRNFDFDDSFTNFIEFNLAEVEFYIKLYIADFEGLEAEVNERLVDFDRIDSREFVE